MINGNLGINLVYVYAGNPTNVSTQAFNPPKGSIVLDTTTPALWQKTSLNDNSAFNQLTVGASGALTPTSVVTTGALETSSPSAGFGFVTGAGGTVTQASSITTGVTLSKNSGQIVTVSSTLAAAASAVFVVTNTLVAATDVVTVGVSTYGGTTGVPVAWVNAIGSGSFAIVLFNVHASAALNGTVTLNVNLVKGVAA